METSNRRGALILLAITELLMMKVCRGSVARLVHNASVLDRANYSTAKSEATARHTFRHCDLIPVLQKFTRQNCRPRYKTAIPKP